MLINKNLCKLLDILYVANEPLKVGDILKALKISQPLCSQRLKILKKYKLITSKKEANIVYYKININYYEVVKNLIETYKVLAN